MKTLVQYLLKENEHNPFASSSDASSRGRGQRNQRRRKGSRNDFRVDIPKFKGQLDPDLFQD